LLYFFQNAKLPDGRDTIEASELNFKNVNRHHAGTYVCTANNGFGREVKEKIHLDVDYSPEIEVEEVFIHAKEANEVSETDWDPWQVLFTRTRLPALA
jgi:hypothetical protein